MAAAIGKGRRFRSFRLTRITRPGSLSAADASATAGSGWTSGFHGPDLA